MWKQWWVPLAERRLECLGSDPLRAVTWLQRDTPSLGFSFSTTNLTIKVGLAQGEYLADCAKWQGAGEEGRRRSQAHVWRLWQHWRAAVNKKQKFNEACDPLPRISSGSSSLVAQFLLVSGRSPSSGRPMGGRVATCHGPRVQTDLVATAA